MALIGLYGLLAALVGCLGSLACFAAGHILARKNPSRARLMASLGRVCLIAGALAFTVCVCVLGQCFLSGDGSLAYVVANRPSASAGLPGFMALAGLWAGREGSLLCWAWLMALLGAIPALGTWRRSQPVDNGALAVLAAVLSCFAAVLLLPGAMPFASTAGQDLAAASVLGVVTMGSMNPLLEHWAMMVHPPLQLLSAAGFAVVFAYAMGALASNDAEGLWVRRCTPFAVASWVLLGLSIGSGALWAFGMYGWGGYWGWDPVQTAGLLPWLAGVALIHSLSMYRGYGQFKRWSIFLACLVFACVMLGGFAARSGLFASVHSFDGHGPSAVVCGDLAIVALLAGIAGIAVRWKTFAPVPARKGAVAKPVARKIAYSLGDVLMVALVAVLVFMMFAPLLPEAVPFGGQGFSPTDYGAVLRPAAVAYCLLMAVCPFLSLDLKGGRSVVPAVIVAAVAALAVLGLLVFCFLTLLLPAYDGIMAAGGIGARRLAAQGPSAYYNGLTLAAFAVAALLVFSAVLALVAAFRRKGEPLRGRLASIGGALCHGSLALLLAGAVGSACYAAEASGSVAYDSAGGWPGEVLRVGGYSLVYDGTSVEPSADGSRVTYILNLDVYRDEAAAEGGLGQQVGSAAPTVQVIAPDQVRKVVPVILGVPGGQLRIAYRGIEGDGSYSVEAALYPMVDLLWAAVILLMLGSLLALIGRPGQGGRHISRPQAAPAAPEAAPAEPPQKVPAAASAPALAAVARTEEPPAAPESSAPAPRTAFEPVQADANPQQAADVPQAAAPSIAVPIEPIRPDYCPQPAMPTVADSPGAPLQQSPATPAQEAQEPLKIEPIGSAWEAEPGRSGFGSRHPGVLFGQPKESRKEGRRR